MQFNSILQVVGSPAYRMLTLLMEAGVMPRPDDWAAVNMLIYAITAHADMDQYADLFLALPSVQMKRDFVAYASVNHCHVQVRWK